ncbi:MAG: hypothetical protein AAFU79_31050 [Myxococcota bacterium]
MLVAILLTPLFASSPDARAVTEPHEPRDQTVEIGVGAGAYVLTAAPNPADAGGRTDLSLGFRLAYLPWSFVGAEAEATYLSSRRGLTDSGGYAIRGHLLGQVPGRLTPFVLVGGGLLRRPSELEEGNSRTLHWGGGLRWYTHANVNLRVDGRHVLAFQSDGLRQDIEITVGFGFALFPEEEAKIAANQSARHSSLANVRSRDTSP